MYMSCFILIFSFWLSLDSPVIQANRWELSLWYKRESEGCWVHCINRCANRRSIVCGQCRWLQSCCLQIWIRSFHFFLPFIVYFFLKERTTFSNFEFWNQLCHCQLITSQKDLMSVRELRRLVVSSSGLVLFHNIFYVSYILIFSVHIDPNTKMKLEIIKKGHGE